MERIVGIKRNGVGNGVNEEKLKILMWIFVLEDENEYWEW